MRLVHPEGWARGPGFSHAILTEGERLLYFSGVIGADTRSGRLVDAALVPQFRRALTNIREVLAAAGARPADVIMLRIYCTDGTGYRANLRDIGAAFREVFEGHYPAMTFLEVKGLFSEGALVEIDGVAAVAGA